MSRIDSQSAFPRIYSLSATLSPLAQHADSSFIKKNSILQWVDCDYHICLNAHCQSYLVGGVSHPRFGHSACTARIAGKVQDGDPMIDWYL